jgi:hypothetical protein
MSTHQQFRTKAAEYSELAKGTTDPGAIREFQELERSFTALADNAAWLENNLDRTVQPSQKDGGHYASLAEEHDASPAEERDAALTEDEEDILHCLGAAVVMQWNTLPKKQQRQLFEDASSKEGLPRTNALKGELARFLHKHKDDAKRGPVLNRVSRSRQ